MIFSDLVRFTITIVFVILYLKGTVNPITVVIYTLISSIVECFRIPAGIAILPDILEDKYYKHGLSLNSSLSILAKIIGTAIAGIIATIGGLGLALIVDALTFIISSILIFFIAIIDEEYYKNVSSNYRASISIIRCPVHSCYRSNNSAEFIGDTGGIELGFKNLIHEMYSKDLSKKIKSVKKIHQGKGHYKGLWRGLGS